MIFKEDSPLFQAGLIKIISKQDPVTNATEEYVQSVVTGKIVPISQYIQLAQETAALAIGQADIITGELSDPLKFHHLTEVRSLNNFFTSAAESTTNPNYRRLQNLGLEGLAGRKIEVERLVYADIHEFNARKTGGGAKGMQGAIDLLHEQQNPYVLVNGTPMRYSDIVGSSGLHAGMPMAIDPEQASTFAYQSIRKSGATVMRYRYFDETLETPDGGRGAFVYISQRDAERIRVELGGGIYNPSKLVSSLDKQIIRNESGEIVSSNPMAAMGALNQKINKRQTANTADRKFVTVNDDLMDLIDQVNNRLRDRNPELYERLKNADALPKQLSDVFMFTKTSDLRLLDAIAYGDDTAIANVAKEAEKSMRDWEIKIVSSGGSLDSLTPEQIAEYQPLVRQYRKTQMDLIRMRGFGQEIDNVSRASIDTMFSYYNFTEDQVEEVMRVASEAYQAQVGSGKSFGAKQVIKYMEESGFLDYQDIIEDGKIVGKEAILPHFAAFKTFMEEGEKRFDGSMVIDNFVMRHRIDRLEKMKQDLLSLNSQYDDLVSAGDLDAAEKLMLENFGGNKTQKDIQSHLADIEKLKKLFKDNIIASDIESVRILTDEGLGKAVADVLNLDEMMLINDKMRGAADFGFLGYGSEELLKDETLFARLLGVEPSGIRAGQAITMEPRAHAGAERFVADVQANVFHSEMFQDQATLKQLRMNLDEVNKEVSDMIVRGHVSKKMINRFKEQAMIDVEDWEAAGFKSKSVAMQFRANAEEILNFILSGGRPDEFPKFANKIINQAAKDVFRTTIKRGRPVYQPVLPFAQRQSVDTEDVISDRKIIEGARDVEGNLLEENIRLMGNNAYKDVGVRLADDQTQTYRFMRYRHDGHKFITPGLGAMGRAGPLYEAGGGFDLDDKFIHNLNYIIDGQGKKRLATFAFRQPTGAQEYALLMPSFDRKTLQRMMGSEDYQGKQFRAALDDFGHEISQKVGIRADSDNFSKGQFTERLRKVVGEGSLTAEDRAIKYLEAVAKGNRKVADMYYGGGITGIDKLTDEQIEQAIFAIQDREELVGTGRIAFGRLEDTILGTTKLTEDEMGRAIYGGTKLQLSKEQLTNLSATNEAVNVSYRNSRLLQIHNASIVMKEDEEFVNRMQKMFSDDSLMQKLKISNLTGTSTFANYDEVVAAFGGTADNQSNVKAAFYLAQQTIARSEEDSSLRDIGNQVLVQFAEMKQRLETIASAEGDPAMLGNYVNTLSSTASTNKQLDELIRRIDSTGLTEVQATKVKQLLYSPYLVHNPEGAIDFAIGGGGTVNFTQGVQDLMDSIKGFQGSAFIDEQESAIKALWDLTKNYEGSFPGKEVSSISFDDFRTAVLSGGSAADDAMGEVQVLLNRVRINAIVQQGETIGRARALYHAGVFGSDEMAKLALDPFIGLTRMGPEDFQWLLQGIIGGAERMAVDMKDVGLDITGRGAREGFGSYEGFLDYYKALRDKTSGRSPEALEARRMLGQTMLRINEEGENYSIRLQESDAAAYEAFSLEEVQKMGREQAKKMEELQRLVKKSRRGTSRLIQGTPEAVMDSAVEDLTAKIMYAIKDSGTTDSFREADRYLNHIKNAMMGNEKGFGSVADFLLNKGYDKESQLIKMLQTGHGLNNAADFTFAQEYLMRQKYEGLQEITEQIYGIIEEGLTRDDRPVDLRRLMQHLNIRQVDTAMKTDPQAVRQASLLESVLLNSDFYERESRIRLDLTYDAARRQLSENAYSKEVLRSEERMRKVMSFIDSNMRDQVDESLRFDQMYLDARQEGNMSEMLQAAFRNTAGVLDLESQGGETMIKPGTYSVPGGMGPLFEDVYPQTGIGPELQLRISKRARQKMTLDQIFAEVFQDEPLTELENQTLKDFIAIESAKDQDAMKKLIMERKLLEVSRADGESQMLEKVRQKQVAEYMNQIEAVGRRLSINAGVTDDSLAARAAQEIQDIFDSYQVDLDTRLESPMDLINRMIPEGAADQIVDDPAYTRIFDKIREKFPSVEGLFDTASSNKGKLLVGAAALAAGAFLYSRNKSKDVTQGDVAGPPLLPGGSAYEMSPSETVQYPNFSSTNTLGGSGESYELQVAGSEEQMKRFIAEVQGISGSTSANMYSTIKDPSKDPYNEVASSY